MTRTKYSPTIDPGDKRVRIRAGHFFNPRNGLPTITGLEQSVVLSRNDKGELEEEDLKDTRSVTITFTPGKTFPRRNPLDDELRGTTATHDELFDLLYGAMREEQLYLDAKEAAALAAQPQESQP